MTHPINCVAEKFDQKCNCFKHIPCNGNDYHHAPRRKNINPRGKKAILSQKDKKNHQNDDTGMPSPNT